MAIKALGPQDLNNNELLLDLGFKLTDKKGRLTLMEEATLSLIFWIELGLRAGNEKLEETDLRTVCFPFPYHLHSLKETIQFAAAFTNAGWKHVIIRPTEPPQAFVFKCRKTNAEVRSIELEIVLIAA